ncbi:MAG TPA: tetratricopeptide repeat protein, partial [Polyangiaceae bacterium]
AEPLAEMLVRKSKNRERTEQHTLFKLLGRVLAALGNHEKALKAYQSAHQLDLTDQESIRGIADAAFALSDWPTSLSNYQKVLTSLGEDDVEQRTDVYFRLGRIKAAQGQARQAVNNFEKALALNPEHRATLQALVDIYGKNNDWKQVAAYKRQILDSVSGEEERYQLLNEIGDIWGEKEKNAHKAIEALEEAQSLRPQDHVLLHKLLQLYQQAGEWQQMVDTIQAIAELEEKPELKARYVYTQAQIYRDKLEMPDRAVELFNDSLDLNPSFLEAFERIDKILTQQRNWKQLERAYRKMLHRIAGKGQGDLEYKLWYGLGIIYRDRLQRHDQAIEAFRMTSTLQPGERQVHQILAELFMSSERWDEAIAEQRILLGESPLEREAYHALYQLYLHKQAYDEAWCQAAALVFLGKADAEQQRFFEDYRPQGMLAVKGRLSNEHWVKLLVHPDENLYVSKIFEMIAPAALQAKINQLKSQGKLPTLDKRFKQDPATSTVTFAKTFGWAAQVLGIQPPELYVRNDVPGGVIAVASNPPASIAGQTVLSGFQPQELTFICGKHMCHYRGEHYIRTLFPTQAELTIMLFAGVMIAAPNTPMPTDMAPQIRATAQELVKHMQPVQLEGLRMWVKRFIDEGAKANIKRWNQAVELTACRAGLVVSGDLEIAKKILGAEQPMPGDLPSAEKMKEVLLFSVSEEYSQVRKALGVAVAVG